MSSLHSIKKVKICPHPVGTFAGVYLDLGKAKHIGIRTLIPCGSWSCPFCRQKNLKRLQARIFNGAISQNIDHLYGQKFLTLTCPGKEYRDSHTPLEAHEEMQKNYAKLVKALKKRHGDFYYLKVVEKHKSGYPHIHVLMSGQAVARKEIKEEIEKLWCQKYGMGFVWIVLIKKGFRAGIKYITKYLVKDLSADAKNGYGHIQSMGRCKRIFTASKGALVKLKKRDIPWDDCKITLGYVGDNEDGETQIFERDIFLNPDGKVGEVRIKQQHAKLDAFVDYVLNNFERKRR